MCFLKVMKNKIILVRKQIILTVAEKPCINWEQKWEGGASYLYSFVSSHNLTLLQYDFWTQVRFSGPFLLQTKIGKEVSCVL